MARQRLGQHFLADRGWQQRILQTLPRGLNQWIEIGPGHGEMTHLLAAQGGRVVAIEADPRLAESLRKRVRCDPAAWPGVEVVAADVLTTDIPGLATGQFRVYGNLPYYITSPILHRLFDCADRIDSIHIVIQLEVAERVVAHPGCREYGYLSAICQFYTRPEIVMRLPPGAFRPPPKVKSALVQMTLPGERGSLAIAGADEKRFLEFMQQCFGQKRKTLRNNLKNGLRPIPSDERIQEAFAANGIRPDARAEQLTIAQFAALLAQLPSL
ncbi:MAG: 16S rRNA (adenine(1518)-N(6)/adenine(1519)-N(6))-dimethyltransferase RsmA [Candidatus Acidiferrales bacterium]|jgi:16S rRNA (adenine1518-N6/adenine1519-N6)-dimethyltransferase